MGRQQSDAGRDSLQWDEEQDEFVALQVLAGLSTGEGGIKELVTPHQQPLTPGL